MNIVITGAGKGIGLSLVQRFLASAKNDDKIFALSRNIKQLQDIKTSKPYLFPIECDITNSKMLENAISLIFEKAHAIDFLVNNAGLVLNRPFTVIESIEIDNVFGTNFKAPFILIQKLLPLLTASKDAHIVNISSMGGFQGAAKFAGLSVYSSSKAALACLTECLAEEFKTTSIKINALCIGAVETEMLSKAFPYYKAPITAVEMAEFIFQFTCFNSKYINGKVIPVALSTP